MKPCRSERNRLQGPSHWWGTGVLNCWQFWRHEHWVCKIWTFAKYGQVQPISPQNSSEGRDSQRRTPAFCTSYLLSFFLFSKFHASQLGHRQNEEATSSSAIVVHPPRAARTYPEFTSLSDRRQAWLETLSRRENTSVFQPLWLLPVCTIAVCWDLGSPGPGDSRLPHHPLPLVFQGFIKQSEQK